MFQRVTSAAQRLCAATVAMILAPPAWHRSDTSPTRRAGPRSDRGDVPGWVMITMMTAIVVIVLIGVFQDAVVNAVKNAFDSITGKQ